MLLALTRRAAVALLPLLSVPAAPADDTATAMFSAGDPRFLQPAFDEIKYLGVKSTAVGRLGDTPAVRVVYDPQRLGYKRVLGAFWRGIDPTQRDGQFGDAGPSAVWVGGAEERALAEGSRKRLELSGLYKGRPLATEVRDVGSLSFEPDDAASGWYLAEPNAWEKARQKSGRAAWFEETYKPIRTTACETTKEGTICGYVYFPCTEENGCRPVLQGTW